jgi:hypothetical protein
MDQEPFGGVARWWLSRGKPMTNNNRGSSMLKAKFWSRRLLAAGLAACLLAGAPARPTEGCLKLVFERYCLGGDIGVLMRQHPGILHKQTEGDRLAVIYPEGRDLVYVLSYKGRIYKVVRKFAIETLLKYDDLLQILTDKYGPSSDLSEFPAYVRSQASKIGAIRRGDGRSVHGWRARGQDWHIRLSWTREMGLALEYIADTLADAQMRREMEGL